MQAHALAERSLVPDLSIVDVLDDLVWHRDGSVSVVCRLRAYHESSLGEEQFNQAAFAAENALSGLPEGTSYQWYVLVDHQQGRRALEKQWPPISALDKTSALLEEFRRCRLQELARIEWTGSGAELVQERQHYLCATFRPRILDIGALDGALGRIRRALGSLGTPRPGSSSGGKYARAYEAILHEAFRFNRRVTVSLLNMGLGFERCRTPEIVGFTYRLLNPTASRAVSPRLSERARADRDRLPRKVVQELPFLADVSPVFGLVDDDMRVQREHLRIGAQYASIVSLKELPDKTEPGALVPLLRLGRQSYWVCYRIDVPRRGVELADLRARMRVAAGLQLKDLFVKTERGDAHAAVVERQAGSALERIVASTQRILGTSVQLVLYESTPEALDEAVEETLAILSGAHGIRGYGRPTCCGACTFLCSRVRRCSTSGGADC